MPGYRRSPSGLLSWLTLSLLVCSAVVADTLSLDNGNLLSGRIRELKDDKVYLDTDWASLVKVELRYVVSMETDELLWVRLKGQDNFRLVRLYQKGKDTWLQDEYGNSSRLDSQQRLAALKADQPDENHWVWSGKANLNMAHKRGEKQESELNTFGSVYIRDRVNRNTLSWKTDFSREDGSINGKETKLVYDYNRFLDRSWYVSGSSLWWYDLGESPYKRYSVGTGIGYQFWDRGTGSLKSDIGFGYLWEDYRGTENRKRWVPRWGLNSTQQIAGNLYGIADSILYYRLGDDDQLLWDLDLGLKYQLSSRLWFNMQYSLDLDSAPPDNCVRSKTSLTFGIGFTW